MLISLSCVHLNFHNKARTFDAVYVEEVNQAAKDAGRYDSVIDRLSACLPHPTSR